MPRRNPWRLSLPALFFQSTPHSGTFIPTLWSKKLLVKFYEQTMLTEVTNTDYKLA